MCFSADASQELGSIKMVILQQHTATKLFVNLFVIKQIMLWRRLWWKSISNNLKYTTGEPCNSVEPIGF